MKRIIIRWGKETPEGLKGVVTLSHFKDGDAMSRAETFTCHCYVGNGSVGMSGIGPKGLVVPLTEEEMNQVNELIRWYFAGRNKKNETFCWFLEEERCCKKKKKVPAAKPRLSSQKGCRTS